MKLEEATKLALQGKLVEGFEEEEKYDKEIDTVLKNFPADFERIDDDQCFKYKNIFVELRPETVTDVNDVPEMDFAVFETEEDMNTDYEQNIGVDYWDISNPEAYWNYVKSYCEAVLDRLNNKEVKTEADGVQDITWLLDEYDGDVDICTKEQLGSDYFYKKLCTSVNDAERFNYHSDYWGDEDTYQEENIALMEEVEPYVGKEVEVTFEDETKRFKILGIAIDKQYNSLSHTVILAEEVDKVEESKEVKTESKYFGIDIPDNELYGSESNTTAYWLLDSVAKYFEDYVKEVESKPEMYQGEPDKERLAKISEMISNASKELKKYWSEAE